MIFKKSSRKILNPRIHNYFIYQACKALNKGKIKSYSKNNNLSKSLVWGLLLFLLKVCLVKWELCMHASLNVLK